MPLDTRFPLPAPAARDLLGHGRHDLRLLPAERLRDPCLHIVFRAHRVLPGVDGAGVVVVQDGVPLFAASNAYARTIDAAQQRLHQGPWWDALGDREVAAAQVAGPGVAGEHRPPAPWPELVPHARDLGLGSVVAVPLRVQGSVVGALALYSRGAGVLGPEAIERVALFARPAASGLTVLGVVEHAAEAAEIALLELEDSALVAQAVGVLMVTRRTSLERARSELRRSAEDHHVTVLTQARRILSESATRDRD